MNAGPTRRRWFQFSLRMLLAMFVVCAVPAWWLRPGVIRPSFALTKFSREFVEAENRERVFAHIELMNAGPDVIWITGGYIHHQHFRQPYEVHSDGSFTISGATGHFQFGDPFCVKPGESYAYCIQLEDKAADVHLTVTIQDCRQRYERAFTSPTFVIPENLKSDSDLRGPKRLQSAAPLKTESSAPPLAPPEALPH